MQTEARPDLFVMMALLPIMPAAADEIDAPYAEELWKASFETDIRWQQMLDCGYLIVSTDEALFWSPIRRMVQSNGKSRNSVNCRRTISM